MLDFMGIGAQKAGTTWLYQMLAMHPSVLFPAGKEVHFWNRDRARGLDWYQSLFDAPRDERKRGEITPAYAMLPKDTISSIAAWNPAVRIMYLLRNPKERAWSSALMALGRAEMTFDEASDAWFIDHFRSAGSLNRGDYEICLRRWRSVFPPGQILVLRYEMLRDNPLQFLTQCALHLGIDEGFYSTVLQETLTQKVFAGDTHPIHPTLIPILEELYHPKIQSLSHYLGWDLTDWL